ncbi:hypothetical protein [Pseudomonas laurylsulfativorans]|nr:hypothetical protein [Pseudomonas laurylsulfativorans]
MEAQLISGAWKFSIFLGVLICILSLSSALESALLTTIALAGLLNIYYFLKNAKSLAIIRSNQSPLSTALAFSFSLAIMTVLGSFDRILAEKFSGQSLFTEYVYFSMILIFPFNMIASYIGFREAIFFKTNFSNNLFIHKTRTLLIKITTAFFLFGGCIYLISPLIELKITWLNMLLSYFLVSIKCIYSLLSSVMGSRASAKDIWKSNIYSATAIIAIFAIFSTLSYDITTNSLLTLFIALWLSRAVIFTHTVLSEKK